MARRLIRALLASVAATALVLPTGCGDESSSPSASGAQGPAAGGSAEVDPIARLISEMSPERKVGQLMLVGFEGTDADAPVFDALAQREYGGLVLDARNYVAPDQVAALADSARSAAGVEDRVPPWVMAPQEGGEFNAFPDLPPDEAPAGLASPREAAEEAEEAADALLDVGLTGILAPVLDVAPVAGGAIGRRAFSDIPERVTEYAVATVRAFEQAGIFSAAKHFPGLGAASQSTELGPANVGLSLDQLARRDLPPFEAAIEAGAPGIVVGHGLYGVEDFVTPASMSETVVTGLLRDDLGFDGVAIADDITAPAVTASYRAPAAAVDAVRAGVDMVQVSGQDDDHDAVYEALLRAARQEKISPERLDEAVERTLVAKRAAGLLEPLLGQERERGGPAAREGGGAEERGGAVEEESPLRRDESRAFPG